MPNKFSPLKARFRATFNETTTNEPRLEAVDKENGVLSGVQITLEGEAKGHGVWLDADFCKAIAEAGNAMGEAGVKVRFGHPAMCSDALGTYLGRARNFSCREVTRKESGEKAMGVFADIFLDPNADRYEWVLNMAESAPDTFGQSIVFTYGDLKSLNADGEPILRSAYESDADFDTARGENKIFAVLGKLHGTDFTDTPAATDGVFSDTDSLAAEAEQMLLEHPEITDTLSAHPEKAIEWLDRMNLLNLLETKRVAGLQAAKDKEIAELNQALKESREIAAQFSADLAERDNKVAELSAQIVENDKDIASLQDAVKTAELRSTELSSNLEAAQKALAESESSREQLSRDLDQTKTDLASTQASLEAETQRYREMVGNALAQPDTGLPESAKSWKASYREVIRNRK